MRKSVLATVAAMVVAVASLASKPADALPLSAPAALIAAADQTGAVETVGYYGYRGYGYGYGGYRRYGYGYGYRPYYRPYGYGYGGYRPYYRPYGYGYGYRPYYRPYGYGYGYRPYYRPYGYGYGYRPTYYYPGNVWW